MMTNRERFLAALEGKPKERMPMVEWATWWDETLAAWEQEGLTPNLGEQELFQYWGLDSLHQFWLRPRGNNCPSPAYHGSGIINNEADYEKILPYLYPDSFIEQMQEWMKTRKAQHDSGEAVTWLTFDGFFWGPRQLLGIERHLYAFYDQPELMYRINRDQTEFYLRAIEACKDIFTPEFMTIAEDMSYNHGPMLSEELFNEFLAPYYHQIIPKLKEWGIHVLVDTDGDVEPMIPWLKGAGIEGVLPLERRAGVDVARIREMYPDWIMIGGYDKTIMHCGKEAMRAEFERLLPVMKSGRYIASVDHQTPPDVTLDDYRVYMQLLNEYAKRAAE